MKNTLRLSIAAIAAIATFGSCTPGPSSSPYHVTGTSGSISSVTSTGSSVTNHGAAGAKITIRGTISTGSEIIIYIGPYAGTTGTFPMSLNTGCQYYPPGGGTTITSVHGTINITSVSPDVVGTFTFTAQDSSVNTGTFHAPPPTP